MCVLLPICVVDTCLCGRPTAHHSLLPSGAQLVKLLLAAMQSVNHVVCRIGAVDLKEDITKKHTFTFVHWPKIIGNLQNQLELDSVLGKGSKTPGTETFR